MRRAPARHEDPRMQLAHPSPAVPSMNRRWLVLALVWAPFVSLFVFAAPIWGGDTYSHVVFHVVALGLLGWAFSQIRANRSPANGPTERILVLVLSISVPLAILGHSLELVAAGARLIDEGWANVETDDIFVEGPHSWAANLTVPMMLVSMLTALVLVAVTAIQRRDRHGALDAAS